MKERIYTIMLIHPPVNGVALEEKMKLKKPLTLLENQKIVGGGIELVRVLYKGKACDLLVNEEGLYTGYSFNPIATEYYKDLYRNCEDYEQEQIESLGLVGTAILMIDHDLK